MCHLFLSQRCILGYIMSRRKVYRTRQTWAGVHGILRKSPRSGILHSSGKSQQQRLCVGLITHADSALVVLVWEGSQGS